VGSARKRQARRIQGYYSQRAQGLIWMLTMYSKNVTDTLSAEVLRKIRAEVDDG
jgi:hypothetical protein